MSDERAANSANENFACREKPVPPVSTHRSVDAVDTLILDCSRSAPAKLLFLSIHRTIHPAMPRNEKRKNPGTPSPQKRSTRSSKRRMGQNSDILLPGGALQTTFPAKGLLLCIVAFKLIN